MQDLFKNILIPADLTVNTEVAINKALELADRTTHIHLLHIQKYSRLDVGGMIQRYFFDETELPEFMRKEVKLQEWKEMLQKKGAHINVSTWVIANDSVQKGIEQQSIQLDVDLVIISQSKGRSFFPFVPAIQPSLIAKNTGKAILTISALGDQKPKKLVVHVDRELSQKTIEMLSLFCRRSQATVQLITFNKNTNGTGEPGTLAVLHAYQQLKELHCPVEYELLKGRHRSSTLVNYSAGMHADLLLVDPVAGIKGEWKNDKLVTEYHSPAIAV